MAGAACPKHAKESSFVKNYFAPKRVHTLLIAQKERKVLKKAVNLFLILNFALKSYLKMKCFCTKNLNIFFYEIMHANIVGS